MAPVVSGPGALSRRTDGNPILSDQYGEAATSKALADAAPMGAPAPQQPQDLLAGMVPFDAPSTRPGEPVTSGAKYGAGPGEQALTPVDPVQADARFYADRYGLDFMVRRSQDPSCPPSFKAMVRQMIASV